MRHRITWFLSAAILSAVPASAGVYICSTDPSLNVPGRINHVSGYAGAAAPLTIKVCVAPSADAFLPSVQEAIALWNARTIAVPNCSGFCNVFDEPQPPEDPIDNPGVPDSTGPWDAVTVLLHELGHCAFGLEHTNDEHPDASCSVVSTPVRSDYTMSYQETSIGPGLDMIPGTVDDIPVPLPGTRVSHWFRPQINDPYLPGPAFVDETTYTRVVQQLPPAPHHWPANANRRVGIAMGYGNAQSVMYGKGSRRTTLIGLIPDDLNTVAYGQAGLDEALGSDDYTWTFEYSETCTGAQIQVVAEPLGTAAGACGNLWTPLPIEGEPTIRHYAIDSSVIPSTLWLNSMAAWTYQFILWDDFEIKYTSFWSETVPAPGP